MSMCRVFSCVIGRGCLLWPVHSLGKTLLAFAQIHLLNLPWSTKWSRSKANRVLSRECTGHSKHSLPITREKTVHMGNTRWSIPKSDWLYSLQPKMEKLYTVSKNKTGSWLWLRSWTPYCQIQTYIEESRENQYTIQIWRKSNPLRL